MSTDKPKPILRLKRPRRGTASKDPGSALLEELRDLAPQVWNPEQPLPLAVGMHQQLFPMAERHSMSRSAVRRFLTEWTSSAQYQAALAQEGAIRFDADGTAAGPVRERDRSRARLRMERQRTGASA